MVACFLEVAQAVEDAVILQPVGAAALWQVFGPAHQASQHQQHAMMRGGHLFAELGQLRYESSGGSGALQAKPSIIATHLQELCWDFIQADNRWP